MVIFLLRHADRSSDLADSLSAAGVKRSELLARMLVESGVSVAFCSDAARTRETLIPLKRTRGDALSINEVSAGTPGGIAAHIQLVIAAIEVMPDTTVAVVVSHSNTVGPIIEGLGGGSIAPIQESEFDKLFILFRPMGCSKTLLQLRY
jgi:phosphohistidine phosphatase SixA